MDEISETSPPPMLKVSDKTHDSMKSSMSKLSAMSKLSKFSKRAEYKNGPEIIDEMNLSKLSKRAKRKKKMNPSGRRGGYNNLPGHKPGRSDLIGMLVSHANNRK